MISIGLVLGTLLLAASDYIANQHAPDELCHTSPIDSTQGRRRNALLQSVKSVKTASRHSSKKENSKHGVSKAWRHMLGLKRNKLARTRHKAKHRRDIQLGPRDPEWFGGFSLHESTYDVDGLRRRTTFAEALDIEEAEDATPPAALPYKWFMETQSGGPQQAWQTYFPSLEDHRPKGMANPPWRPHSGHGHPIQEWMPEESFGSAIGKSFNKEAGWFETGVTQYDAFGRGRAPSDESDHMYEGWQTTTAEGALTCEQPGCTASVRLQVFDHRRWRHARCRLSVHVHPTDFDDEYSREHLEWITLNNHLITHKCDPMVSGCHDNHKHLYPCVNGRDVDKLLGSNGTIEVVAKLSRMVDECPVDGNLLSGVVSVTCYVLPRLVPVEPPVLESPRFQAGTALLRCTEPGCTDTVTVYLKPHTGPCYLRIMLDQTDFDNDHGSVEELEWLMVNKHTIKTKVKPDPRRNQCKDGLGPPEPFPLLPGKGEPPFDVTEEATRGAIEISAKISDMVDECGVGLDGQYLLSANATVECAGVPFSQAQWPSADAGQWVPVGRAQGDWVPHKYANTDLGPLPATSGSDGWVPAPSKSGTDGQDPAPPNSGSDDWVPAPSKSGNDGWVPAPSKSGNDGWVPAPSTSGNDGWVPAPSKSGDEGWEPAPSRSGDDGWEPAPSHSAGHGASGHHDSGEGEWEPAPSHHR